mmetsp:Transcript_9798/g.14168  ORF Transcript_9798/g.14168 Transcript_9798/m.14168 type:complete len:259 (-) Transcript_9798:2742-3518(-)
MDDSPWSTTPTVGPPCLSLWVCLIRGLCATLSIRLRKASTLKRRHRWEIQINHFFAGRGILSALQPLSIGMGYSRDTPRSFQCSVLRFPLTLSGRIGLSPLMNWPLYLTSPQQGSNIFQNGLLAAAASSRLYAPNHDTLPKGSPSNTRRLAPRARRRGLEREKFRLFGVGTGWYCSRRSIAWTPAACHSCPSSAYRLGGPCGTYGKQDPSQALRSVKTNKPGDIRLRGCLGSRLWKYFRCREGPVVPTWGLGQRHGRT